MRRSTYDKGKGRQTTTGGVLSCVVYGSIPTYLAHRFQSAWFASCFIGVCGTFWPRFFHVVGGSVSQLRRKHDVNEV